MPQIAEVDYTNMIALWHIQHVQAGMSSIVKLASLPDWDCLRQICQKYIRLLWKVPVVPRCDYPLKKANFFQNSKSFCWLLNLLQVSPPSNLHMILVFFFFLIPSLSVNPVCSAFRIHIESQLFLFFFWVPIISYHLYSYHSGPKDCSLPWTTVKLSLN